MVLSISRNSSRGHGSAIVAPFDHLIVFSIEFDARSEEIPFARLRKLDGNVKERETSYGGETNRFFGHGKEREVAAKITK